MTEQMQYKCPCCSAPIAFDSASQSMKCEYCDNQFSVDTLKEFDDILAQDAPDSFDWSSQPGNEWMKEELEGRVVYLCKSCGGQIVCEESTGATDCPYCGNPVVIMGQFSGDMRPDLVIPFKLDKEAAKTAYLNHLEGKRLLPKLFKSEAVIDEIKGLYVPFWLFDADADANIRYRATLVRRWSTSKYNYTETSFYELHRKGSLGFNAVPVDGSTRMADDLMESIEPFDLSQAVDFQTAYLSGYLADRYDVNAEQSKDRANTRIKKSTEEAFADTARGFTTVLPERTEIQLKNGKVRYALYPVWLLNCKWEDKNYTFAMNGQTGKLVGDLPMSKSQYWKWFGIIGAITTAIGIGCSLFCRFLA